MKKEITKKVGIWILALALFMAHIFFRSIAHADEGSGWRKMYSKSGECVIDFPSAPQMVEQSVKLADTGQRLNYDIYLAPYEDKGVFLLLIATYPLPLSGGHEVAGLEGLLKGIVGHSPDHSLIFADLVDYHGHPALNFLIQGQMSYFRGQAVMVGNKLFLIAMEGRKESMQENIFTRFLKSFQLLVN